MEERMTRLEAQVYEQEPRLFKAVFNWITLTKKFPKGDRRRYSLLHAVLWNLFSKTPVYGGIVGGTVFAALSAYFVYQQTVQMKVQNQTIARQLEESSIQFKMNLRTNLVEILYSESGGVPTFNSRSRGEAFNSFFMLEKDAEKRGFDYQDTISAGLHLQKYKVNIQKARLDNTVLSSLRIIDDVNGYSSIWTGSTLIAEKLTNSAFESARFDSASLRIDSILEVSFRGARLDKSVLACKRCETLDFQYSTFGGAMFDGLGRNLSFAGASMGDVRFSGQQQGSSFSSCTFNEAVLEGWFQDCSFHGATFLDSKLGASIYFSDFTKATIRMNPAGGRRVIGCNFQDAIIERLPMDSIDLVHTYSFENAKILDSALMRNILAFAPHLLEPAKIGFVEWTKANYSLARTGFPINLQ